jgi:hypothetical protein
MACHGKQEVRKAAEIIWMRFVCGVAGLVKEGLVGVQILTFMACRGRQEVLKAVPIIWMRFVCGVAGLVKESFMGVKILTAMASKEVIFTIYTF